MRGGGTYERLMQTKFHRNRDDLGDKIYMHLQMRNEEVVPQNEKPVLQVFCLRAGQRRVEKSL